MSKVSQTESGKAWEYGLACAFADQSGGSIPLAVNSPRTKSQNSYHRLPAYERNRIIKAAKEAVNFLYAHDKRLESVDGITMQSDMEGKRGDVRDILAHTKKGVVGISAKHRHAALKHSRLSGTIDFGDEWYGRKCSSDYWGKVLPVFEWLRALSEQGKKFRDIPDKQEAAYVPILEAFIQETTDNADPEAMMRYLIGKYDFYKVMKENGSVLLQSFNIQDTLEWGKRVPLPSRIIRCEMGPQSKTTANMYLDKGWQLSFRIHSARSKVEPSLKFDVQLPGVPSVLSSHEILYPGR